MKQSVVLRFGEFAREALEEQANLHRGSLDEVVRVAALHHLSELESGRIAPRVSRFHRSRRAESARAADPALTLELELDDPAWSALHEAAVLQRIGLERLIEYAIWCYLADLDSGLVTARILERAERRSD